MFLGENIPTVLQLYLDDTRNQLKNVERVLTLQNDIGQIILAAHSIRAASAHMGVTPMVDAANALEAAAHEKATGEAQQNLVFILKQIKGIFARTEEVLQARGEAEIVF